jgi:ankyrin repeat protein
MIPLFFFTMFFDLVPYEVKTKIFEYLPIEKSLDLLFNKNIGHRLGKDVKKYIVYAIKTNNLEMVKWLTNQNFRWKINSIDIAAKEGNLNIVKYLHQHRPNESKDAFDLAASHGYLDIVKFLHYNRNESGTSDAIDFAAKNGDLEMVAWITENVPESEASYYAMDYAARNGHLEVVEYLFKNRDEGSSGLAYFWARDKHHYKLTEFLLNNDTNFSRVGDEREGEYWDTLTDYELERFGIL